MAIRSIEDVAAWQLCCGCGLCAYVRPDEIEMIDTLEHGRRPRFRNHPASDSRSDEALRVCPGVGFTWAFEQDTPGLIRELLPAWGPVLEVWEGFAADPEIRYEGASGGIATALALHAIERGGMHGALHIRAREDTPFLNQTVLSTTRGELLAGAGSRYAPASPCDGLQMVERAPRPCVFIGKPCDVAAVHKAMPQRAGLRQKIGPTIAFFCAGTPTTLGTLKMLEAMGIRDPTCVTDLRYRGRGWPGPTTAGFMRNGRRETRELTYEQSWGEVLQKHRQWRCYICADHTGAFADIAVADAWHRPAAEHQPGRSLVIARTVRGRESLRQARQAGYVVLEPSTPAALEQCRPGHTAALGALWGRLSALRLMGLPSPRYRKTRLFGFWCKHLNVMDKSKSTIGTVRRVFRKRLHKRQLMQPWAVIKPAAAAESPCSLSL